MGVVVLKRARDAGMEAVTVGAGGLGVEGLGLEGGAIIGWDPSWWGWL